VNNCLFTSCSDLVPQQTAKSVSQLRGDWVRPQQSRPIQLLWPAPAQQTQWVLHTYC